MMPSSNTYDVEIVVTIRAENQIEAWKVIYLSVHDILESMLESGRIIDWTLGEPDLVTGYDSEKPQSP